MLNRVFFSKERVGAKKKREVGQEGGRGGAGYIGRCGTAAGVAARSCVPVVCICCCGDREGSVGGVTRAAWRAARRGEAYGTREGKRRRMPLVDGILGLEAPATFAQKRVFDLDFCRGCCRCRCCQ